MGRYTSEERAGTCPQELMLLLSTVRGGRRDALLHTDCVTAHTLLNNMAAILHACVQATPTKHQPHPLVVTAPRAMAVHVSTGSPVLASKLYFLVPVVC